MPHTSASASIHGILPIDKPQGWTSHDVVARVRRITGQRQVGHAGTLDPLATGLLLVVLGAATRLSSYLMDTEKVYCAEVVLGVTTNTDDAEGSILDQCDVPSIDTEALESSVRGFIGEIDQIPPKYAAVKQDGQRLYALARKGIDITPQPRRVVIHAIHVESFHSPHVRLYVRCSSGTYIRSLARDLGASLSCGAYLHALRRVSSGAFSVDNAAMLDGLTLGRIASAVQPLDRAVCDWPAAILGAADVGRIIQGQSVPLGDAASVPVRLYGPAGTLVALGECNGRVVRPFRVFVGEIPGADGP